MSVTHLSLTHMYMISFDFYTYKEIDQQTGKNKEEYVKSFNTRLNFGE